MTSTSPPGAAGSSEAERGKLFDPLGIWRGLGTDWTKAFGKQTAWPGMQVLQQAFDYWVDAWQRSVLFLDVMRQRGNNYAERSEQQVPHVLQFKFEPVMNGRELERPVNYGLVRVLPPEGVTVDPRKRPFIVFDPRAGHGPGIGGMKHDSEIGVALEAGHPCYFVGFIPHPMPSQTVEDVCRAEALFVRKVAELHPEAEGKPCLVGNCQAGWQIMMMSAANPDLVGPIMLAGSPLSYWAGVRGKNPMRYTGGLLGGTWLTSLSGDLGNGIFDGAYLVQNFEYLNPANTYWDKSYNVYSKIDTEPPRYLDFEKWWGNPVLLNAKEMQFIADELFVGNKLAAGEIVFSDGVRIDLRNIKSPIIVFCSWGDNITPPQQALGWVLDLYDTDGELAASGQTIVYSLHQTIGHLGIFVSAKVATKEHEEFTQTMDLIDVLPPGLYEAVFTKKEPGIANPGLVAGDHVVRFEARSLNHIRALGGNEPEDDLRFATVARVSEINQGIYRSFASPVLRSLASDQTADWQRRMHPHRVGFEMFSDRNPWLRPIAQIAESVRQNRRPVDADNPFLVFQETMSKQISETLDRYREMRDQFAEALFMTVYGSPALQAAVGLRSDAATALRRVGRDVMREAAARKTVTELEHRVAAGGAREAMVRALLYVGRGRPEQFADERGFNVLRQIRAETPKEHRTSIPAFKAIVHDQYLLLQLDEERAVGALPQMLPEDAEDRERMLKLIRRVAGATGEPAGEAKRRLARIEALIRRGPPEGKRTTEEFPWKVAVSEAAPAQKRQRAGAEPELGPAERQTGSD